MTQPDPVTARIIKERRPIIRFLYLLIAPISGWKGLKNARYSPDYYARSVFYPLLALMAAACFAQRFHVPGSTTSSLLQQAVSEFVACFAGYFCRAGTGAAASTAQRAHQGRQSVRQGIHNVGTIGPVSCCNTLLTVSQPRGTPHGSPHLCVIYYSKRCAIPARACRRHPAYIGSYGSTNRGNPSANIHVVKIHDAGSIRKYHVNNRNTLHL